MAGENKNAVQFYCTDEEIEEINKASDHEMRSMASFAKYSTLKAARQINGTDK